MDIYIVLGVTNYEGSEVIGCCSTEELAKKYTITDDDFGFNTIEIIKMKLDEST